MSRSDQPDPSGILVIDKPPGLTSHDVVARVRRMVGMKRVGHGGTLDPFATGVLPVAVGRATRILQFVQSSSKGYLANAVLGVETDSGDVEGTIVSRSTSNAAPPIEVIRDCLRQFTGTLEQVPPVLSAIKLDGQPLHRRVRSGEKVEASPRTITIYNIEIVSYEPPNLCIAVACASGAYVRALVRDIGRALGTHAYCHALRRTNAGPFCLGGSWTLSDLRDVDLRSEWPRFALGMDSGVTHLPAILIAESEMDRWYHGRSLTIPYSGRNDGANLVRIYDAEGRFAGIGQHETTGSVSPRFVLLREPGASNP